MAHLIFSTLKGRELARQPLRSSSLIVGRSHECDVCVQDILLSRRHCRLEPEGAAWFVVDLASKNGTFLQDREIGRVELKDGQTVRLGKTAMTFYAAKAAKRPRGGSAYHKANKPRPRPADPLAEFQSTLVSIDCSQFLKTRQAVLAQAVVTSTDRGMMSSVGRLLPTPQPRPKDPQAYESEGMYSFLAEFASSSWDSIYLHASRPMPMRPTPRPLVAPRHPRHAQATPAANLAQAKGPAKSRPRRWHERLRRFGRGIAMVGQAVLVAGLAGMLLHR